jgi:hypothetical protein
MEVWHWKECDIEYASTAYFYAQPGATHNRKPQPDNAAKELVEMPPLPPPITIKGAIECETLPVVKKSDGVVAVAQGGFADVWSKDQQLWVQARKPGDFVEIMVPASAKSKVIVHATKSWDYGIVRFSVNGTPAGQEVDLYSGAREVKATGPLDLGAHSPRDGGFVIRCEVVGGNAKSEGTKSFFGLDCIVLEPAKE